MRYARVIGIAAAILVALAAEGCGGSSGSGGGSSSPPTSDYPIWQAQIDFTKAGGVPWTEADFAALKRSEINRAEINLDWGDLEPLEGQYQFKLLDSYLEDADQAGIKLNLIFWESVWAGGQDLNPPAWLTAREVTSDGITAQQPPWWDQNSRQAYFDYVTNTIDHVNSSPAFGGLYANYGWLDAMWGPRPAGSQGVTGYAPADIQAFYQWLPQTYKTLANFNATWNTSYSSWGSIPAAVPGDPLFPVYQAFRYYSVEEAYDELSLLIREHTNAPVFYYWGGGIGGLGGPPALGNDPDTFFRLSKNYEVTIVLDDADQTGNALLFGSMARAYGVSLLQEWTPSQTNLDAEIPQWLGHIGLGAPLEAGESFFIYPPPTQHLGFADAWQAYQDWHATLANFIQGSSPEQPVAVLVPTLQIAQSSDLTAFSSLNQDLTTFWQENHVLPQFITDQEVANGVVSLEQFNAVVDLGNEVSTLPALETYAADHPVLTSLDQALPYLQPYVTLNPAYNSLEVTPTTHGSSVWLALANCNGQQGYLGSMTFDAAALGLTSVSLNVSDVKTGQSLPATRISNEKIQWQIDLPPSGFQVLQIQ